MLFIPRIFRLYVNQILRSFFSQQWADLSVFFFDIIANNGNVPKDFGMHHFSFYQQMKHYNRIMDFIIMDLIAWIWGDYFLWPYTVHNSRNCFVANSQHEFSNLSHARIHSTFKKERTQNANGKSVTVIDLILPKPINYLVIL